MDWSLTVGAVLVGGGFSIVATGTASKGRLLAASILWLIGFLLLALSAKGYRQRHGGGGKETDLPATLKQLILDGFNEGQAINRNKHWDDKLRDAPPWQNQMVVLLESALLNQECLAGIRGIGSEVRPPFAEPAMGPDPLPRTSVAELL